MADVAKEAGVVRQTLYAFVKNREQLTELALLAWCEDLKAELEDALADGPSDLDDALVEFLARAVEIARADEEFVALAGALGPQRTDELLAGPTAVQAIVAESLGPLLERARKERRLRAGVDVAGASRWLQGVLTFMTMHEDLDQVELREELRLFALPSILTTSRHNLS